MSKLRDLVEHIAKVLVDIRMLFRLMKLRENKPQ